MQARPRWPGLAQSVVLGALGLFFGVWAYATAIRALGWPPADGVEVAYLILWTVVAVGASSYVLGRIFAYGRRKPFVVLETASGPVLRVRKVSRLPIALAAVALGAICVLAFPDHAGDTSETGRGAGIPLGLPMAAMIAGAVVVLARWPAARPYIEVTTTGLALVNGRDGFACTWEELDEVDQEDQVVSSGLIANRSPSMQVRLTRGGTPKTFRLDPAAIHGDAHELLRLIARMDEAGTREQREVLLREAPSLTD